MSSLQPPSLPAWDFDDLLSGSEPEVDFSRQPYELQQQSVRKPSSKRTTSTDNAAGGGGGGVSPLAAGPIPQGPNRPRSAGRADSSTAPYFPREGEALMQRSSSTLQQQPPHQPSQQQQQQAFQPAPSSSPIKASRARSSSGTGLNRSQTLLSHSASPYRSSQELSRLLAKSPSSRKLGGGADGRAEDDARLEAGRRKARVTLDVDLEREVLVEGGDVKGTMVVVVRPGPKKEGPVHVGQGKIRLVGFEDVPSHNGRHIFYHHSATLPLFMPGTQHRSSLFTTTPGTHHPSNAGSHPVPFHLPLPLTDFPRGPHRSSSSSIRYILVASISLFFPLTGTSSIAHFYRNVVVYPKIDPARVLGTAGAVVESARSFGTPGGKGVELGVKLGKSVWVAGMSCWVDISMYNGTNKKIKSLTIQLWQTSVLYHPSLSSTRPNSAHTGIDPGSTSTKQKKVAETVLQEAQASGVGRITGKGWFTGCGPMTAGAWSTSLLLPSDALSIPRGRLIEVGYSVRVSVDSKIVVEVPIRIVNFISIDPPPSTYRAPTPPAPVRVVAPAVPPMPPMPVDTPGSPKSTYTDGVIGYDTISRPRGRGLGASTLGNGTLASTLKKARSMGSLAFPGEMGNRLSSSSGGGPLRVANRHSSDDESGADDDDDENDRMADADEDALERRGLIRRKASMAFLKEAVDAAARENDGFDELHEQAYGYSYEADLGVDIPKLVEEGSSSTYVAVGEDTLAEEDEDEEEAEEVVVVDRPSSSLMLGRPTSSPLSPSQTVVSEEGAFAYDEGSLAPTVRSRLPALTPTSELPPSLPPSSIGMESSASIGQAMQLLLLDDASSDSDDNDEDLYEAGPRFPIKPRPSSPALRAARAASMVSLSPNNPRERQGSDATFVSARNHHPSHRLSTAWGGAAGGSSSRPASTYAPTTHEPTYEEVRNAVMQGRRQSALTPEPAFRSNGRLSINTDLIHPETIAKPRTPSPRNQVIPLPPASPSGSTSSPARSVNQRKSFTFASPAAPIRVKASVGSREGSSPARLRASKSSVNLARSATQDSPVKTRSAVFPSPANVSSPARPASAYSNHTFGSGRDSPTKLDPSSSFVVGAAGSPRRSRTVHSPTKGAPAIREVPALTDHHASSDSGSASEVTPPLSASAFPPVPTTVTALQFADKLQFTNRHLSQHFDPSFDATNLGGGPPRANSFDVNALPSRVRPPGSPSVKSKIQNLEGANQRPASTPPSEGPPQLRRSATTASPRYGPSDDLKFIRPGVHRRDTSVATVDEDLDVLAAESNLRRAPSGVSFKAPLLRHSKSMAGNLRQN